MTLYELITILISAGSLLVSLVAMFMVINISNKVKGNDNQVANLNKSSNNYVKQTKK